MCSEKALNTTAGLARFPDYSSWLADHNLLKIEDSWKKAKFHEQYAVVIKSVCAENALNTILELGCGTGWVPYELGQGFAYVGVDSNSECVDLARKKNPGAMFVKKDIRNFRKGKVPPFDVVCAFAVFKHFGLHEWRDVFRNALSLGKFGIFSMSISEEDHDDGTEFHHVWVSEKTLTREIELAGHEMLETRVAWSGEIPASYAHHKGSFTCKLGKEWIVVTRRKPLP